MDSLTDITDAIREPLAKAPGISEITIPTGSVSKSIKKSPPTPLKIAFPEMSKLPEGNGLLDVGELEANKELEWEPEEKPAWKPATQVRLRVKRALHLLTVLVWKLSSPFWPKSPATPEKLRPTAWLDGLKGFAALLVYFHHHELWTHEGTKQNAILENGFGNNGEYHFATFPGARNFFTGGHYAVSTFFVVSGYVLSAKPLSLIQQEQYSKLSENLASALFRRWLRLYIPVIVTTFIYMSTWHIFDLWIAGAIPKSTWREEAWWWYLEFKNFSFVYRQGGEPWFTYNFHTWSIPVEFKGSIVVYSALVSFSRLSKNARLWCQVGLVFYFMWIVDGWYCAMFAGGMLLCDLDQLASKKQLPRALARLEPYKEFIYYHLFVASLYLGGVPSRNQDVQTLRQMRGWYYLSYLKPQAVYDYKWFYLLFAAITLVAAIPRIRWLKAFFESRFCQYLGRLAFSLYVVHGPVIWTIGDRIYTAVGWHQDMQLENLAHWADKFPLPKTGPLGLEVAFLLPHLILLPLTFWLAEMVTKFVDEPSVRFAQWLYKRMLPEAPRLGTFKA